MTNKKIWLGMLALALIFGMTVLGCGGGGGDGNGNPQTNQYQGSDTSGKTYILVITVDSSGAAPQAGDSYTLTIKQTGQADKVSTGTVTANASGTLTLQPSADSSETFDVSVSGTDISSITGDIAVDGGDPVTPGTINPVVTFSSVTANGTSSQTTTTLTLTFSQAIPGLSAGDITLTGVSGVNKGTLSGSGPTYTLGISGFTAGGTLTVTVAKSGYTISGGSKTVTIFYSSGNPGGDNPTTPVPIEMVQIQGGTFAMGSPESEPNRGSSETQHLVTLTGFGMSKHLVTQAQYQAVMGSNPSSFKVGGSTGTGTTPSALGSITDTANFPVERVSWYDALVFCNKLSVSEDLTPAYRISESTDPAAWGTVPTGSNATWNAVEIVAGSTGYRLPTEAQWEYACRAGTETAYNTGATISDNTGWYSTNSGNRTHSVGEKPANVWGLYDMHGNVFEWCWDWYGTYESGQTDPTGAVSGSTRVRRGGSWNDYGQYLRSAYRVSSNPYYGDYGFGFRLVRPAQ